MKNPKKRPEREIRSDDEVSDGEPMDAIDAFHETVDYDSEAESETHEFEVAPVDGRSDSEGDEMDDEEEDDEDGDENPHFLPSKDALGKKTSNFQGTDYTAKEVRKMKQVEKEQLRLDEEADADQRKDDFDAFLQKYDWQPSDESDAEDSGEKAHEQSEENIAELTDAQKIKLLKRQCPLLFPLIEEYKVYNTELATVLRPLKGCIHDADARFKKYVENRTRTIQAYLINIAFYLRLKAKATLNLEEHPVVDRLARLRGIIDRISSDKVQDYMEAYLTAKSESDTNKLHSKIKSKTAQDGSEEEIEEEGDEMEEDQLEENVDEKDDKRGITYKMEKNRGLKSKGQKKRRNPRVKNRLAYEQAVKRRKGQVRSATTLTRKYTGEASGIRAGIKKSVRIKS